MTAEQRPGQPPPTPEQLSQPAELCAQSTLRYASVPVISLGSGIESRYLGEDDVRPLRDSVGLLQINSVTTALREKYAQSELVSALIAEDENVARARVGEVVAAWGATVADRAAELGLAEEQPRFEERDGWNIITDETAGPMLVVSETDSERARKRVVRLDALNESDPEFLQTQIRGIHEAIAAADLSELIQASFATHDPTFLDLLPDALRHLYETPEAERLGVANTMLSFLDRMITARGDAEKKSRQVINEFSRTQQALAHRKVCKVSPEEDQASSDLVFQVARYFDTTEVRSLEFLNPWYRFLRAPHKFMPTYTTSLRARLNEELERLSLRDSSYSSLYDEMMGRDRIALIDQENQLRKDDLARSFYLAECGLSDEDQDWLAAMDMPVEQADEVLFTAMFHTLLFHLKDGGEASRDGRPSTVQSPAYQSLLRQFLTDENGQLSQLRQQMLDRPLPVVSPSPHPSPEAWEPGDDLDADQV